MASGTIWLSSTIGTLQGKIEWSSYSNGSSANSSTVTATLYIARTDGYTTTGTFDWGFNVGGITDSGGWYGGLTGNWVALKTITNYNVAHNSDGTGSCWISGYANGPSGTSMSGHSVSGNQTVTLDSIPRYANITEFKVQSTGLNSITIKWNADSGIDYLKYSLNGGNWVDASGLTFTIYALSPGTTYSIKINVRRSDSGLWTESNTIYGTTKDIGRLQSVNDFNLGDSVRITKTNPSSAHNTIQVETLNPISTVATREDTLDDMTIVFTDEELDLIYKKLGTNNSTTIRFVVDTHGDSVYYDWKDVTCTLTGNQKTGHLKLNNDWKRVKHYRKINNEWKHCVRWININGTWKRCI